MFPGRAARVPIEKRERRRFCRYDISLVYIFVPSEDIDSRESRVDGLLTVELAESALVAVSLEPLGTWMMRRTSFSRRLS
jgi:hypothetical protein